MSLKPKAAHQILAKLHRFFGIEAAENLFAPVGIHRGKVADEFLARLIFCVLAPTDPDRDESGDDPNDDVGRGQFLLWRLFFRVARVVGRIHVGDLKRPVAVNLDNRFTRCPGEMLHLRR